METYIRGQYMPFRLDTNEHHHLISSYFEYQTAAVGVKASNNLYLTYKFSKEQYVLPEDDLRIETCRSVLNVLV